MELHTKSWRWVVGALYAETHPISQLNPTYLSMPAMAAASSDLLTTYHLQLIWVVCLLSMAHTWPVVKKQCQAVAVIGWWVLLQAATSCCLLNTMDLVQARHLFISFLVRPSDPSVAYILLCSCIMFLHLGICAILSLASSLKYHQHPLIFPCAHVSLSFLISHLLGFAIIHSCKVLFCVAVKL